MVLCYGSKIAKQISNCQRVHRTNLRNFLLGMECSKLQYKNSFWKKRGLWRFQFARENKGSTKMSSESSDVHSMEKLYHKRNTSHMAHSLHISIHAILPRIMMVYMFHNSSYSWLCLDSRPLDLLYQSFLSLL